MKPLVSIIVPAYNAEKTITKCLDSLVNQTLKELEILVINDNSKDNTESIVQKYVKKYKNIKLFTNSKNLGPSGARNKGLENAQGKYIGFVDSDDYVDKTMYQKMSEAMTEDIDLVACGRYNISSNEIKPIINQNETNNPKEFSKTSNYITEKLFKKVVIEKHNLRLPEKYSYAEDFAFLIRYKYYANKMIILKEPLYYYLADSEGSITNSHNEKILDIISVLNKMISFFKKEGVFEKYNYEILEVCAGYYVRRIKEFKYYDNTKLQKKYVKEFLSFFKKNFKHYKKQVNLFKTKYYRFYRCSWPLMNLYIVFQQIRRKLYAKKI